MRCAVIADVHGNLEALKAVLNDIGIADEIWCLGDVVGYGPEPAACVEIARERRMRCIAGNGDWQAIGKLGFESTTPRLVFDSSGWTGEQLHAAQVSFLDVLPEQLEAGPDGSVLLVHSSTADPLGRVTRLLASRLTTAEAARPNFAVMETPYCLIGHNHLPLLFFETRQAGEAVVTQQDFSPGQPVTLGRDRFIMNVGAVGQPRDGDPRAAYVLYERDDHTHAETLTLRRVPYDIEATQRKLRSTSLPPDVVRFLALALERGASPSSLARQEGHPLGEGIGTSASQ